METKDLSLFAAKKAACVNKKEHDLSLSGIVNYIAKRFNEDKELKQALSCVPGLSTCKTQQEIRNVITFDFIKECLGEKGLHHWSKSEHTDKDGNTYYKLDQKGELRKYFSFWVVISSIQRMYK